MDLNDYWQDNKRFVTTVACGVVGFLIGMMVLNSVYDDDIKSSSSKVTTLKNNLRKAMFTREDMATAEEENDALREAVERLGAAVQFLPRDEFRLDPSLGSASNQYLRALTNVRDDLIPLANRNNLSIDQGLGMPKLSPTRDAEIERYLEALDVIETVVRLAIEARMSLHVDVLCGRNDHHKAEAAFKAVALALRSAVRIEGLDPPSTKGTLG